ncbi:MAG: tetratricopeptide repeat protein [Myxococcales bacterium]|nr:tetratricopeptide repeat protein [Myxococcales bacterium]
MLALALALAGACTKQTPAPVEPEAGTTKAAPPTPLGDTSAAYAGHDEGDAPRKRERPAPKPVDDRDAALDAVVRGNPDGAIDFLTGHLTKDTGDLPARLALARAQIMVGQWAQAQATLADPAGAPNDPEVLLRRARLAQRRGDPDAARALLDQGIRAHPRSLPLRGELLSLMTRRGQAGDPAAVALRDGLYDAYDASEAKTAADLVAVAQAALSRGSGGAFHDANMVLQDAESLAPVEQGEWVADDVLLLRGAMFLEKYAQQDAAETFGLILGRDPWHPDALVGLARVHLFGLRFAEASRGAEEALQVDAHHPDAHAVLGRIALIEGRRDEARERGEQQALSVDPHHVGGLAVLAGLAIAEDDAKAYARWRDRALGFDPRGRDFFVDLGDILGFLHLYPEADRILREGAKLAPDDPYVQSALGLNLLRLGHEQEGRDALARAWKRDKFNERTRNTLDLYRDTIDPHYDEQAVGDLTVRLPKQDREFIEPGLLASVRRSRDELDAHYGMKAGKLRLEFYADPQAFSVRTVGVPSLGALAVCFGPVITFVGPYTGAYDIDMVIRHELSHTYAIALSGGRVPRWFTEGLSEWESELADPAWARESAELLSQARRAGKLRRLGELELAFIRAESGVMMEVAYATAAYAMRYLGQTYGRPALVEILRGYRTGAHTDALFREHLGKDLATVEKEFEAWFFAQLDQKVSGWEPTPEGRPTGKPEGKPESKPKSKEVDERDALLAKAIEQAGAGDTADATRTLQELLTSGGDGYVPRMMLAKLLLDGPSPAGAVRHLQAARGHHTEAIEPLVLLANLARKEGRVDDEKAFLGEALAIDGDSLEPAARLLMLALVTKDAAATDRARQRIRGIAPLHPISLAAQALALSSTKGDKGSARAHLRRALRDLQPGQGPSDTFVVAALAAQALGQADDAKTLAKAALQDPELPQVARDRLASI